MQPIKSGKMKIQKIKKFEKRLKTYLKRYGTSKLNIWTYLRD